jgi:Ca2+-binding RTX toxin-like protein
MARRQGVLLVWLTAVVVAVWGAGVPPASASVAAPVVGAAAGVPTCHGHRATIFGPGTLVGTSHRDVIVGTLDRDSGPHHQLIRARAGNDLVCAGPEGSRVYGGTGDDRLFGQGDYVGPFDTDYGFLGGTYGDVLNGGPGDDLLDPGIDPAQTTWSCVNLLQHYCRWPILDRFSFRGASHGVTVDLSNGWASGQGDDRLVVTPGWDSLEGSTHDDVLRGTDADFAPTAWHLGGDEIYPLAGADVVRGRGGSDKIVATSGDDTQHGGAGADRFTVAGGHVTIFGGPGDDWVQRSGTISSGRVTVSGGAGQDQMDLGGLHEGDAVNGDTGTDHLSLYDTTSDGALVGNLATGAFAIDGRHASYQGFEQVMSGVGGPAFITGTDGPDVVLVDSAGLTAHLRGGDDTVTGGPGDDFVDGGAGTDTANLFQGNDVCVHVEFSPYDPCAPTAP